MTPRRLAWQTLLFTAIVVVYHFVLRWLMLHHDLVLGDVGPGTKVYRIVPIYAYVDRHINIWLVVCIAAVVAYLRWAKKQHTELLAPEKHRDTEGWFTWKLAGWFLLIVVTVAMLDKGPERLWRPFDVLHDSDYIGGVDAVSSPKQFLHDYIDIRETLPMHCQTHPPGAVLFLWFTHHYLGPGPKVAAFVTILFAALSIPAVVGLSRLALKPKRAHLASCLFVLAPNVILFTATSMEAVFMVPMIWTVYLLFRAALGNSKAPNFAGPLNFLRHPVVLGILAGLSAALAAMMTFSVALIALWAILLGIFVLFKKRDRFAATLTALVAALCTSVVFYILLYLWSGYNLIDMLIQAIGSHESIMSGGNYTSVRNYFHLVIGNLVAFLVGAGIPITVLYLGSVKRDLRPSSFREKLTPGRLLNYTFLTTLILTLLLPLYTLEVERIWIFLVPFLAIGAARRLDEASDEMTTSTARLAMILLAVQVIVMESFLETLW